MRFNVSCFHDGGQFCGLSTPEENARRADALPLAIGVIQVAERWRHVTGCPLQFGPVRLPESVRPRVRDHSDVLNPTFGSVNAGGEDFSTSIIGNQPI